MNATCNCRNSTYPASERSPWKHGISPCNFCNSKFLDVFVNRALPATYAQTRNSKSSKIELHAARKRDASGGPFGAIALEQLGDRRRLGEAGQLARDAAFEPHLADVELGVQDRGVEIGQRDRLRGRGVVLAARLADDLAFAHAAAKEGERRKARIMVAAA